MRSTFLLRSIKPLVLNKFRSQILISHIRPHFSAIRNVYPMTFESMCFSLHTNHAFLLEVFCVPFHVIALWSFTFQLYAFCFYGFATALRLANHTFLLRPTYVLPCNRLGGICSNSLSSSPKCIAFT